jgi:putative nucleotidyltransferase with HDIG domain
MTGSDDLKTAIQAIRAGASDFILKPFSVGDFLSRFDKAREEWQTREKLQQYARALETLVRIRSEALLQSSRRFEEVRDMTVASLGAALDLKDHETADHCARVSENSVRLGRRLELSDFELQNLRWGAYLHDMGKIGIPESILLKAGALSPGERATMEKHPLMGCTILRGIEFLAHSTDVVLSHHERYDGRGYPHGLQGTGIPLNARIFSVLDALDAMTSRRPYREPLALAVAARELQPTAGTQFDPEILEIFLRAPASTWMVQETPVGKESTN